MRMSSCFAAPHGIAVNMAAVEPSAYETFTGGMEVVAMDMDDKIKGAHLRGNKYTVSQDGLCPRCGNSNRLYVILDKLFPMGDMPEILHTLIAKGRAILWSSQEKEGYQDPPTFLCRGFCPPDPLGAGFNVNWSNVSLNQILESLDRPMKAITPVSSSDGSHFQDEGSSEVDLSDNSIHVLDEFRGEESNDQRNALQTSTAQSSSDKEEQRNDEEDDKDDDNDENDDDDDDEIDEEELIKQMLAKEQQKLSQQNSHEDGDGDNDNNDVDDDDDDDDEQQEASTAVSDSDNFSEQITSSSNVISNSTVSVTALTAMTRSSTASRKVSSSEANTYPVSSTGRCPYCGSSDVKYIIMVSENTKDTDLPQGLQELLKRNHAFKMAIGDSQPPSFQCQKCQYGFNLNWSTTSLEQIFGLPAATSSSTTAATTSASYKTTYKTPAGYPSYPPPVGLPPLRYPPPGGIPPPVPYQGYTPTYSGFYGSYYPPPSIPPPAGSYPPFPPAVPPPGILPLGLPPPGIPHPVISPPGIPPPGIPSPGILPPGIPPPGIPPPSLPHPGIPPPGYPVPAIPPVPRPSGRAWGTYPFTNPTSYYTPPRYPPSTSAGYIPLPAVRPYRPPPTQARPPIPWQHPSVAAVTSAASVPTQNDSSAEQEVGDDKVAAARFEMVLNQIDQAKARVRHERDLIKEFQKEVHQTTVKDSVTDSQQYAVEPNALTDEGQQMAEYDEKPPGEEDSGFEANVIMTESLEQGQYADASMKTPTAAQSMVASQLSPTDSENPEIAGHLVESGDADHNSTKDLNDDVDADNDLPEVIDTVPKETVPVEDDRSVPSKKKEGSPGVRPAPSTRQTRRSRKTEPVISTEDTDSTAAEEEAPAVTGRSRRSRKAKAPRRKVERLDIRDVQEKEMPGGVEVIDSDMAESSDMLSQSSAVPATESDSQNVPSESLASSSEAETAPAASSVAAGPQRGRTARGRKRKQESVEKEVVSGPPARKTRRGAAESSVYEEQPSEDSERAEDEKMALETPFAISQEEDTEVVTASSEEESSRRTPMDTTENTSLDRTVKDTYNDTKGPVKPDTETRTSKPKRQTRKSSKKSQEPETAAEGESRTIHSAEESTGTTEDADAMEVEKTTGNRRTRRSAPRNAPQGTNKPATKRQTRTSLQLNSQDSNMADAEEFVYNDEAPKSDTRRGEDNQPSDKQENMTSDISQEDEMKTSRRTRASRKSSASSEDASANTRLNVLLPDESDSLTTEEVASSLQARSRKSPALHKVEISQVDTSAGEDAEKTPKTRKSRKSLNVKENTATEEVQFSAEPVTPEESVSSRRTRRNKSTPSAQEAVLSQESADNLVGEEDIEEEESTAPPKRVSIKTTPVESTETVTKRVTRSRQKK